MVILTVPRAFGGTLILTLSPSQASISITATGWDGKFAVAGFDGQISGVGSSGQLRGIGQSGQLTSTGFDGQIVGKD